MLLAEAAHLDRLYAAWNARDRDAVLAALQPRVEFRTSGAFPGLEPVYHGREGVARFWDDFHEPWDSIEIVPEHYVGSGAATAALWRFEGSGRGGVPVRRDGAHLAWFEDGLVTRFYAYADWERPLENLDGGERAALLLRGWAALNEGDVDAFAPLMAPDAEFVPLVGVMEGASYRGPEGLAAYRGDMLGIWERVRWHPQVIRLAGDRAHCHLHLHASGGSRPAVHQQASVTVAFRGGLVRRLVARPLDRSGIAPGDLAGVWRLVEWTSTAGPDVRHPAGRDARGLLVYLPGGVMSVHVAAADGSSQALAYCGRWELRGDEVVHHVEIDARPERPGTAVTRSVHLRGDELTLTKPPEDGRVEVVRWRRQPGA